MHRAEPVASRRPFRAAAVIVAVIVLSGCRIDAVVGLNLARDGSGVVTVEAVADAAVVDAAPGLAADLRFDDARSAGWSVEGPTATDDGGLRVLLTAPFRTIDDANVLLRSVSGDAGPLRSLTLVRTGGVDTAGVPDGSDALIALTGGLGVTGGLDAFADPQVLAAVGATPYADDLASAGIDPADAVTVRLDVSVPGRFTAGGEAATTSDGIVSWVVPMGGDTTEIAATWEVTGGSWWTTVATVARWSLVLWVAASIVLITVVMQARRRRRQRIPVGRGPHPTSRPR